MRSSYSSETASFCPVLSIGCQGIVMSILRCTTRTGVLGEKWLDMSREEQRRVRIAVPDLIYTTPGILHDPKTHDHYAIIPHRSDLNVRTSESSISSARISRSRAFIDWIPRYPIILHGRSQPFCPFSRSTLFFRQLPFFPNKTTLFSFPRIFFSGLFPLLASFP